MSLLGVRPQLLVKGGGHNMVTSVLGLGAHSWKDASAAGMMAACRSTNLVSPASEQRSPQWRNFLPQRAA